jgi:hypothetical protein
MFERATVTVSRPDARVDDFEATKRRIIDSFAFFAVVVADVVGVLFLELPEGKLLIVERFNDCHKFQISYFVRIQGFRKFISPKLQRMF